ncbi:MAG: DUF4424 family protein [Armatimonadetes bacterium]|nr:DUF4424 family protein [Armatimonadota bacterium]
MGWWWLCLAVVASVAWADDGALRGAGGSPAFMDEHPSVRMVSEVVDLHAPSGWVTARFVFRNDGPACTVAMGFPETIGGMTTMAYGPSLGAFRSWLDGRPLRRRWVATRGETERYRGFWQARVRFGAGQTRVVMDRYRDGGLSAEDDRTRQLTYVLRSGASWRGPIGDGLLRVHCDTRQGWTYTSRPASRQVGESTLVWRFHDLEPSEDFVVRWRERFECLTVNGPLTRGNARTDPGDLSDQAADELPARTRGQLVWMTLRQASRELGLNFSAWPKPDGYYVELHSGQTMLQMREGSRNVLAGGHVYRLREPLRREDGWLRICLQDLVAPLGGTWRWRTDPWGLVVDLPRQAESAKG